MIWFLLIAGALGAVLRYLLDRALPATENPSRSRWRGWPRGILVANVLGSFALGLILGYARAEQLELGANVFSGPVPAAQQLWVLSAGFCASLTTASTLFVGFHRLYQELRSRAVAFLLATLVLAGSFGALGFLLTK